MISVVILTEKSIMSVIKKNGEKAIRVPKKKPIIEEKRTILLGNRDVLKRKNRRLLELISKTQQLSLKLLKVAKLRIRIRMFMRYI